MTEFQKLRQKAIFEAFDKFPDLPNMTIAKLLYARYPELFNNLEHCRSTVRMYRGVNGEFARGKIKITKYFKNEI